MDENLKNETQEKDLEAIHNSMFDQNTEIFYKDENMNREYLKRIHNGADMNFLPKEVRLTRKQYYKMVDEVETESVAGIEKGKKQLVIISIIFLCVVLLSSLFFRIGKAYEKGASEIKNSYKTEASENNGTDLNSIEDIDKLLNPTIEGENDEEIKGIIKAYNIASGVVRAIGWAILSCGSMILFVFAFSSVNIMRYHKKRKEIALRRLEAVKQEHMILGTYDAEY